MSYKDLLVVMDASNSSLHAARCTANLAVEHEAHVTALYLEHNPLLGFADTQLPPDLLRTHQENLAHLEEAARTDFEESCRAAGVGAEWRSLPAAQLSTVMLSARYTDLVAMSAVVSSAGALVAHRYADSVVMAAGRPVLLFPESCRWDKGFRQVMVAWEGSREATRAVHDAMPLLEKARKVVIMEVADKDDLDGRDPAPDIARHLARHGVLTESAHAVNSGAGVAEQLLSASVDCGADLLVAGAYGHSRLREYAIGGVTRHLLTHLTIPMLLSH
ncbi:MAG: universal stress protein [Arenicellales bacterium]